MTLVLGRPAMKQPNWVSSFLSSLLSLYTFLIVICYFNNVVKSDKVTTYIPKVFDTYQELLKESLVEYVMTENTYDHFKGYDGMNGVEMKHTKKHAKEQSPD